MKKAILITLLLFIPSVAFAAGDSGSPKDFLLYFIDLIITIWTLIMSLITILLWRLLSPDWINGTIFGMEGIMKELWILMSNIVYLIFAFLLIVIAFMNIIWKWWDNFALKTALPKFIVWVIMVPFTWFIVQFVVSLSSVLTASVMQLPASVFPQKYDSKIFDREVIPSNITIDVNKLSKMWDITGWWDFSEYVHYDEKNNLSIKNLLETSPYNLLAVYSYDLLWFQNIWKVWKEQLVQWTIANSLSLIIFQLFKVIFFVVYIVLLVSMFFALFVRIVRVWLFMIASPLFWLLFYFGSGGESMKSFEFKQFLSLAFVPVYVWAALSFWIFFLKVVQSKIESPVQQWQMSVDYDKDSQTTTLKTKGWGNLITIKWDLFNWQKSPIFQWWVWNVILWPVWNLIINCITLAIIRITVMAALKGSEITGAVIEPIATFGKNIWWLVSSLPQYTPIPFAWLDIKWLWRLSAVPAAAIEQRSVNKANRYNTGIMNAMWANFDRNWYYKMLDGLRDNPATEASIKKAMKEFEPFIKELWINSDEWEKALKAFWEAINKDPALAKKLKEKYWTNSDDFTKKDNLFKLFANWNEKIYREFREGKYNEKGNEFKVYKEWELTGSPRNFNVEIWMKWTKSQEFVIWDEENNTTINIDNANKFKDITDIKDISNLLLNNDDAAFARLMKSGDVNGEIWAKILKTIIKALAPDIDESTMTDDALEQLYKDLKKKTTT
jgi:hypothetical protein